jgi:glycosyltransferase involved in cell wall biosynthesis
MSSVQISAVIITFNEERNIRRCLTSLVGIVDEVVVLDSFSTDQTEQICVELGVRFVQHAFDGHIEQKNRALGFANFDHVLSLDADETLSPELRQSILHAKTNWSANGYTMNRLTNYCGQWIHHSGWYPDRKLRLFDRRLGHWGGTNPHDRVEMNTAVMHLDGDLLHYSYYSVSEHLGRARKYADIAAHAMYNQGKRSTWGQICFSPIFKFLRNYLFKGGFLDGLAGFTICRIAALETYWKYVHLKSLRKETV